MLIQAVITPHPAVGLNATSKISSDADKELELIRGDYTPPLSLRSRTGISGRVMMRYGRGATEALQLDDAYATLEIHKGASLAEIKRACRRLMSLNYPDKLMAKGLPEEMISWRTQKPKISEELTKY